MNVFGQLTSLRAGLSARPGHTREVTIIVAAPGLLWPDYAIEVDDEFLEVLELDDSQGCDSPRHLERRRRSFALDGQSFRSYRGEHHPPPR